MPNRGIVQCGWPLRRLEISSFPRARNKHERIKGERKILVEVHFEGKSASSRSQFTVRQSVPLVLPMLSLLLTLELFIILFIISTTHLIVGTPTDTMTNGKPPDHSMEMLGGSENSETCWRRVLRSAF